MASTKKLIRANGYNVMLTFVTFVEIRELTEIEQEKIGMSIFNGKYSGLIGMSIQWKVV